MEEKPKRRWRLAWVWAAIILVAPASYVLSVGPVNLLRLYALDHGMPGADSFDAVVVTVYAPLPRMAGSMDEREGPYWLHRYVNLWRRMGGFPEHWPCFGFL